MSMVDKKNKWIHIKGAREHNLKNIDVSIPKNTLTVITGPSGSGKSSLALDILYTEGKRRYMESLSSYARQFLGIVKKPDFDSIEGLCPSIAIEQKTVGANPRSTVGTITEIYDYLRVLFARIGKVHCPDCGLPIQAESPQKIVDMLLETFAGQLITIHAPIAKSKKGEFVNDLLKLFSQGFYRFWIDGRQYRFRSEDEIRAIKLQKTYKHDIDLVIDAIEVESHEKSRLTEAIETAFKLAGGTCKIVAGNTEHLYSSKHMCVRCAQSVPELEPRVFSFNSPIGACGHCHGLGVIHQWPWNENDPEAWKSQYPDFFADKYAQQQTCPHCYGKRLNKFALAVTVGDKTIYDLGMLSIKDLHSFFNYLKLSPTQQEIAQTLSKEISARLQFLNDVGLSYLSLNRTARTLSGGEGQRIRLATQIGSALSGVLYILDEPSIGLHQRDNDRLIETLKKLRDLGNTVVVVEHDHDTMEQSDYIIDMGPAAGIHGGRVTATGTPAEIARNPKSLTGSYLSGKRTIKRLQPVRKPSGMLILKHATKNNLKDLTVQFPLGVLCAVSGVSGSGKSTLIMQELVPSLERAVQSRKGVADPDLTGTEQLEHLVVIDQTPIGRTPRSNPATYLGVFDDIRKLYAGLPESNARGYKVGRFSFNVAEGRCFECSGDGVIKVEMQFLPEVTMVCKTCNGKRYNSQTLEITYKGKNIADVLDMTALEAAEFFAAHQTIAKRLNLLCEVGLDYLKLGQAAITLSGGEAQRIKLVDELAKRGNKTMYILDEPTTGLHASDIEKLLVVLNRLVDKGNSMIVIEHNLDVLKTADYLIDMGPEGGDKGGTVVAHGSPFAVSRVEASHTGRYLRKLL
ncbi:UvrABC system protein A [Candidatus Dependentiae bacterium Noda2021]|nr:UvrABC system protein A [Candidatus Dependentiae bacterium Noda2021]